LVLIAVIGSGGTFEARGQDRRPHLTIDVDRRVPVSSYELRRASMDVNRIFGAIGITTDWRLEQPSEHSTPRVARGVPGGGVVHVVIIARVSGLSFGESLPLGSRHLALSSVRRSSCFKTTFGILQRCAITAAQPGERLRQFETICGPRGGCQHKPWTDDPGRVSARELPSEAVNSPQFSATRRPHDIARRVAVPQPTTLVWRRLACRD
jgi:hypothetical protein